MTIKEAGVKAKKILTGYYDSREVSAITDMMLEDLTGFNRVDRILHDRDVLTDAQLTELLCDIKYLQLQMPVQYVLGYAYFADLKLKVNSQVLIPRPETEELVDWAVETIAAQSLPTLAHQSLLDIGTGSGCIPLAIKRKCPALNVMACDISDGALGVARHNARLLDLKVSFSKLDILDDSSESLLPQLDYIISNPPYIDHQEKAEMEAHVLAYEPHLALFPDLKLPATVFYQRIGYLATRKLKPGGHLFFEVNPINVKEVLQMLDGLGFTRIELKEDLQGKQRMVKCLLKN